MTGLSWASRSTPVGLVSVGCSQAGVARVRYGSPPIPERGERGGFTRSPDSGELWGVVRPDQHIGGPWGVVPPGQHSTEAGFAAAATTELTEYFRGGRQTFDVPVDWTAVTGPHRHVLTVLAETVRYGETTSYGALARRARLPADQVPARAVGAIMAANPIPVIVPCHRVLASDGLGGYSGGEGIEVKRWLLILEGSLPPTLDWDPQGVYGHSAPDGR